MSCSPSNSIFASEYSVASYVLYVIFICDSSIVVTLNFSVTVFPASSTTVHVYTPLSLASYGTVIVHSLFVFASLSFQILESTSVAFTVTLVIFLVDLMIAIIFTFVEEICSLSNLIVGFLFIDVFKSIFVIWLTDVFPTISFTMTLKLYTPSFV